MAITLRDVARRCGLSPSTVSGVLNNRSGTWASAETRRRILEAAESLGYRPNQAARALRTGKTQVIAFLFHFDGSYVTFDGAAEIIAARLSYYGYELKLHVFLNQKELMEGLHNLVRRQSCDAVLLFGSEPDVAQQGAYLEQHNIPFVVKGRHERDFPHWYQVDYDHEGMMEQVLTLFGELGHQRIAYTGYHHGGVYQERLRQGFCTGMERLFQRSVSPSLLAMSQTPNDDVITEQITAWFSLPEEEQPTAVAIGTGNKEWHTIERVLAMQGRKIGNRPEEVAVAGQAYQEMNLAFGSGYSFADVSFASIAETVVADMLVPILQGEPPVAPIRRILPPLLPTRVLGLPFPDPDGFPQLPTRK